jgi:cytochrome c peroxidase
MRLDHAACGCLLTLLIGASVNAETLTPLETLGKTLFFDDSLSEPAGQSCASCHAPEAGFADPDRHQPTSEGVNPGLFGVRNTPSVAYAAFSPVFRFDVTEGIFIGGQFWDGRASDLEEQAGQPLLNPLEMANTDSEMVVDKVRRSGYASRFEELFGDGALDDVDTAFTHIATAIGAYERSSEISPFTSKYDAFLAGDVALTAREKLGLELFEREDKGNCAACHPSKPSAGAAPPLFTDFSYDNLGVPKNLANPFYRLPESHNPEGAGYLDLGLGGPLAVRSAWENGKFKVPTLRNVALTAPYMHNGVFSSLRDVVAFYNTRDTDARWGTPEIADNVNTEELGDLGLSDDEVDAVVAFMLILSDGYTSGD